MVEGGNQSNNEDSGDDIQFVDSDDDWNPEANRGQLTKWLEVFDLKINKEGTARGFKQYAAAKMQREQEELKDKTAEEQK